MNFNYTVLRRPSLGRTMKQRSVLTQTAAGEMITPSDFSLHLKLVSFYPDLQKHNDKHECVERHRKCCRWGWVASWGGQVGDRTGLDSPRKIHLVLGKNVDRSVYKACNVCDRTF